MLGPHSTQGIWINKLWVWKALFYTTLFIEAYIKIGDVIVSDEALGMIETKGLREEDNLQLAPQSNKYIQSGEITANYMYRIKNTIKPHRTMKHS